MSCLEIRSDKRQETTKETQVDEYFEPSCKWKRGKESDTIEIELDGFQREDLKVTLNPVEEGNSTISITAESPIRIRKQIEIPNDYDLEKIRTVLISCGNLILELPKKTDSSKLEISMRKLEIRKFLQESAEGMRKKFFFAVEYSYPKLKYAVGGGLLLASGFFAYKYYTECYGVELKSFTSLFPPLKL